MRGMHATQTKHIHAHYWNACVFYNRELKHLEVRRLILLFYSLADVGYRVHPAPNADFVAYIWRVAEFMHDRNVVGIWTLEQLLLQCNCVNLQNKRGAWMWGWGQMRKIKTTANNVDDDTFCIISSYQRKGQIVSKTNTCLMHGAHVDNAIPLRRHS